MLTIEATSGQVLGGSKVRCKLVLATYYLTDIRGGIGALVTPPYLNRKGRANSKLYQLLLPLGQALVQLHKGRNSTLMVPFGGRVFATLFIIGHKKLGRCKLETWDGSDAKCNAFFAILSVRAGK